MKFADRSESQPIQSQDADDLYKVDVLEYTVDSASSYSNPYLPELILVDRPADSSSRWSTEVKPGETWILLKLKETSVISSITFGKFHRPHPCNLSEFKVLIGSTPDQMQEILHDKLENDHVPQTFSFLDSEDHLRTDASPCLYIKILPLSSQMAKYHASIWHLTLRGTSDPALIDRLRHAVQNNREREATRLILKHLRQRRLHHAYRALIEETGVLLEDPLVSRLHDAVVNQGDYLEAEAILQCLGQQGSFTNFLSHSIPQVHWRRIRPEKDSSGGMPDAPCRRGGHAMCIDPDRRLIYMLGGWDGARELPDLWLYDINDNEWRVLSLHTSAHGGPGVRSGHAMVFDRRTGAIYVLGRYMDAEEGRASRPVDAGDTTPIGSPSGAALPTMPHSDLYRYMTCGTNEGRWEKISSDTAAEGGPNLLYDHQMVIDSDSQRLYVFGGEIVGAGRRSRYAGMYSYDLVARRWTLLFDEKKRDGAIPSRQGHNMLLDQAGKLVYIFSGYRDGCPLADFWTYSLVNDEARLITNDIKASRGPDGGLSQRAIFDPDAGQIRVLLGLIHSKGSESDILDLSCWTYYLSGEVWIRLANHDSDVALNSELGSNVARAKKLRSQVPRPRYGHQVVYDTIGKIHFMFGGNPGKGRRLDDLWAMTLERPSIDEALRKCRFLTRRQSFIERCERSDAAEALAFLQDTVGAVVNHADEFESGAYRALMEHILRKGSSEAEDVPMIDASGSDLPKRLGQPPDRPVYSADAAEVQPTVFKQRMKVFEDLLCFVDVGAKQPSDDLMDFFH